MSGMGTEFVIKTRKPESKKKKKKLLIIMPNRGRNHIGGKKFKASIYLCMETCRIQLEHCGGKKDFIEWRRSGKMIQELKEIK